MVALCLADALNVNDQRCHQLFDGFRSLHTQIRSDQIRSPFRDLDLFWPDGPLLGGQIDPWVL